MFTEQLKPQLKYSPIRTALSLVKTDYLIEPLLDIKPAKIGTSFRYFKISL